MQHIFEIDEIAIVHMLREIVGVVEMNNALIVRGDDILGKENAAREILGNFPRHIIPLHAVDRGIFIGVFLLHLFVIALDERENLRVRGIGFSHEGAGIAVSDVFAGENKRLHVHEAILHHILDLFHADGTPHMRALLRDAARNRADFLIRDAGYLVYLFIRLSHRIDDFFFVKRRFLSASFDNFHFRNPRYNYYSINTRYCI